MNTALAVGTKIEPVHVMRESTTRPGAFRLICGANPRQAAAWVIEVADKDGAEPTCRDCLAILQREARR